MTRADFVKLTTICSQNSAEQAGSITFTRDGDSFIFSDINVLDSSDKDKILYSGKKRISLDYESLLYSIYNSIMRSKETDGIVVLFHTHPGIFSSAYPSDPDKENISRLQNALDELKDYGKNFTYIVGIITSSEIGFYYSEAGKIKRVRTYVDLVEHNPIEPGDTALKAFFDGIKIGRGRGHKW